MAHIPPPAGDPEAVLQAQVANLDYSEYLGRLAIGRVFQGTLRHGDEVAICHLNGTIQKTKITKLYSFEGLKRVGLADATDVNGLFPYACILDSKHNRLYVSLWGASSVAVLDTKTDQMIARWETGQHPCEMALSKNGKTLLSKRKN